MKSLSEYQLQEAMAMQAMDRVRTGLGSDTVLVQAQTMTLREMAVSFSKEMDEIRNLGVRAPSFSSVDRFEKEVLSKVAGMRRYSSSRSQWYESFENVNREIVNLEPATQIRIRSLLDSARTGYPVYMSFIDCPEVAMLPDSLKSQLTTLFRNNEELAVAWNRLSSNMAVMYSEDLNQFFRMENLSQISLKSKIPMAFYFLSLVLLLSTFFFIFRSKQ